MSVVIPKPTKRGAAIILAMRPTWCARVSVRGGEVTGFLQVKVKTPGDNLYTLCDWLKREDPFQRYRLMAGCGARPASDGGGKIVYRGKFPYVADPTEMCGG